MDVKIYTHATKAYLSYSQVTNGQQMEAVYVANHLTHLSKNVHCRHIEELSEMTISCCEFGALSESMYEYSCNSYD